MENTFLDLFITANLTSEEKKYFLDDAKEAIENMEGFSNAKEYYKMKETRYCIVKYALPKYKNIAISGLKKILSCI